MREVALSLTRAAHVARCEGRHDDERRIMRALTALLSLDVDDDPPSSAPGTRLGLYASTLVYKRASDRLFVGCWGDVAERLPASE